MAAVTGTVIATGAAAYSANRQSSAAKDSARAQREGVEAGIESTRQATEQALPLIDSASFAGNQAIQRGTQAARSDLAGGAENALQSIARGSGLARDELRTGTNQAIGTLQPLVDAGGNILSERDNLLGLGGQEAYQQALSRVADPLAAEQEQAILRNSAALGGVGGNVLSELADQTRRRTEANISNRINTLGNAASPSLNAMQQVSQMQNLQGQQGSRLAENLGGSQAQIQSGLAGNQANLNTNQGNSLAQLYMNAGQTKANTLLGQGSQLAQLNQNAGNATAGAHTFQAQQTPAAVQALTAGLSAYQGLGGTFGTRPPTNTGATQGGYTGSAMQQWLGGQ
jgi:hypothetical protein